MGLEAEYPKHHDDQMARWQGLLAKDSELSPATRERICMALDDLGDLTLDLKEILNRLLTGPHTPKEIGELLIAIELTLEQIRGCSDEVDGKLYEIGDRLKGIKQATRRSKRKKAGAKT